MAVEFESPPHATETAQTPSAVQAPRAPVSLNAPSGATSPPAPPTPHLQRRIGRANASLPLRITLPILLGAVLLIGWQLTIQSGVVSPYLLPAPADVARSFWQSLTDGLLLSYALATLGEALSGFAIGAVVALPLGYALAKSRWLAAMLEPYLAASQAMPAVALAPLIVLWLGYGLTSIATLCALIVFFPMVVNTMLGVQQVDDELLDAARVDGAGAGALLLGIEAPLALRAVLAGLRVAVTLSVTGAVVGEFVLGDTGLGGLLNIARGNFDVALVFATLLALALLAGLLYGLARLLELASPALIALALALLTGLLTLRSRLISQDDGPAFPTSPTPPTSTTQIDTLEAR
ncbi:MAG: ABC transporter permease [Ktedonobacterales bacterium]